MAAGIVYLDVDDEITSAASRIRTASGTKVALVVPYGSRIATSRMNFRLLSREALVSNRRLSIVAGDAAARSLAASAGLPVFATVAEYEASLAVADHPTADEPDTTGSRSAGSTSAPTGLADSETVVAIGPAVGAAAGPPQSVSTAPADAGSGQAPEPDGPAAEAVGGSKDARRGRRSSETRPVSHAVPELDGAGDRPPRAGSGTGAGHGRSRAPLIAGLAVAGLGVLVLAVGAYLFLPSATITLTPRREPIGPIELTVAADPTATAVDPTAGVVPALRLDVPVEVSQTFTTTGTHVDESPATGSVTFTNLDTGSGVSIPSGSVVLTEGGVRFRTQATVALRPAAVDPSFQPTSGSVAVTAAKVGEQGNVPANTIRVVPQGQDPVLLRVNNPDPTSGGSHTETPEVSKAEVDKAVTALHGRLQTAFDDAIKAGAGAPAETTLFPATATLGAATPSVDPQTLVGRAQPTFDLGMTASGTVIAVDPRPVRTIAEARLRSRIGAGHRLVDGSIQVEVGAGTVGEDGQVTFQATARATTVAIVDADQLRSLVKGKTLADAEAALATYGAATVELWPSWVTTVTGVDTRLTITISDGTSQPGGSPASSTPPTSPSAAAPSRAGGATAPSPATSGASPGAGPGTAAP